MQMIVVAVDWSEHSERAVEWASDMASKYGSKLVAVHVIPDKPIPSDERHLAEIEFADELRGKLAGMSPLNSLMTAWQDRSGKH